MHKRVKLAHFETILSPFQVILAPQKSILGYSGPSEVQKALKVGLVVMGFTCKLISLCQEPSTRESFLMSLISHS